MQDYSDFDLDKATEDAWTLFADQLAEVVANMDESGDLRIDAREGNPDAGSVWFRFVAPDDIRAEATSNAELGEEHLLGAASLQLMEDAGWTSPDSDQPRFTALADQEDTASLAKLAVVALRDAYGVPHPAFLNPDQLSEILIQRPEEAELADYDPEDVVATVPVSKEHLDTMIALELEQLLGAPAIRDSDGDFAIRVGSSMVFVRATPDAHEVIVFSVVVHDVEGRSRAVEFLNDLNAESRYVRFELVRDRVFLQMSVLAHPFVPAHLLQAVRAVSEVADGVDEELARKFNGRTTFGQEG